MRVLTEIVHKNMKFKKNKSTVEIPDEINVYLCEEINCDGTEGSLKDVHTKAILDLFVNLTIVQSCRSNSSDICKLLYPPVKVALVYD